MGNLTEAKGEERVKEAWELAGKLGCRRCGGWGYIRHMVPAACPTCDLCNGTGADPDQSVAPSNGERASG